MKPSKSIATQSESSPHLADFRWGEHPQHPPLGRKPRRRFVVCEGSYTLAKRSVSTTGDSFALSPTVATIYHLLRLFLVDVLLCQPSCRLIRHGIKENYLLWSLVSVMLSEAVRRSRNIPWKPPDVDGT